MRLNRFKSCSAHFPFLPLLAITTPSDVRRGRLAANLDELLWPVKTNAANERFAKHLWTHRAQNQLRKKVRTILLRRA